MTFFTLLAIYWLFILNLRALETELPQITSENIPYIEVIQPNEIREYAFNLDYFPPAIDSLIKFELERKI